MNRVAIIGGTHGNETNGVYLAKHFIDNPALVERETFTTDVVLANVASVGSTPTQARRYVDVDLNRCFLAKQLEDEAGLEFASLEHARARELDAQLGPKASPNPRVDFVMDLHNTSANTGVTLIMMPHDAFAHEVAAYLMTLDEDVHVVEWPEGTTVADCGMIFTVSRSGMVFEVGACPWSCLVGKWYAKSRRLLLAALDFIDQHNKIIANPAGFDLVTTVSKVLQFVQVLDYPRKMRSDGCLDLDGMIHPALEGRDFSEIKDGDDLFMKLDCTAVKFDRRAMVNGELKDSTATPLFVYFVNEAAYYEKGYALMLAKPVERSYKVAKRKGG